ncbi:2-oxoacid:acceptor oxidoreductase family protein [archaeon]|nr:2-oxoacid:acceptor oxidoreductase family protein [archaeon]
MKVSVLIGGKAGQGINKVSQIISDVLIKQGHFTFNYRDYPSLIRGGHNFNILSISNTRIGSHESKVDFILAMDKNTIKIHKKELKKEGIIISYEKFKDLGINLNIALAGAFTKILGIEKKYLIKEIKKELNNPESIKAAEKGFNSQEVKFNLKKQNNKIKIISGSQAVAQGAINSKINRYFAYPMTPATGVMNELAEKQIKNKFMVFQPENEIAVVNAALGSSFAGANTMIGTSGGGFDLMSEGLSFQGISEIPLVVYLSSRPGPGTGVPTYSTQSDLNIALRAGHGEFPRVVIAPGDPKEAIEKTNEAFYLTNKFNCLSILLSDKHLAESEFSTNKKPNKILKVIANKKLPGKSIVKASSYEHDKFGNTTEDPKIIKKNQENRLKKYSQIKTEAKKFEMIKIYGKRTSKKLIIGWGSTKGVILDAIENTDYKFLQILYLMPMSNEIKKEIKKAKKVVLVENNLTGQLGRIIREKTGIEIKNRILRYDSRPFLCDELRKEIRNKLK